MNKIKNENKILIMLALFSISIGLWGNFRQLWLQDNNFLPTQISNIISIGTFASVIGIIIVSKFIHLSKLKRFIGIAIILKFINSVVLYFLNSTGYYFLINISIVIDIPKFDSCEHKITLKVLKILVFFIYFTLRTFRTCDVI